MSAVRSVCLYRSMLAKADEMRELASQKLSMPVLAVGGGSGEFTATTIRQVATDVTALPIDGIGHHAAMEAPDPTRRSTPFVLS